MRPHRLTPLRLGAALALLLAGCADDRRANEPQALKGFPNAVVSFVGHIMLRDRARDELGRDGFAIVLDDDQRLQDPAFAAQTVWIRFQEIHTVGGMAVEVVASDHAGVVRYHATARREAPQASLDAAVEALAPFHGEHHEPPSGHVIEL